jgi:DNA-binding LytR/AlgR family response regulator
MNRVSIVEDEIIVAKDLQFTLQRLGYDVSGLYTNYNDALSGITPSNTDIIIMDIMLKGVNDGVSLTKALSDKGDFIIIFLSAFYDNTTMEHALFSDAYMYLLKPYNEVELNAAIKLAQRKRVLSQVDKPSLVIKENFFFIKTDSRHIKVIISDLLFIEALKDYVMIHLVSSNIIVHITMKELESRVSNTDIIRIHRSFFVSKSHIVSLSNNALFVNGHSQPLPIGGSYRDSLFKSLHL